MVSIKDIAKYCGVSTATVSKALNDQSDISQATKDMVRKAAAELGYVVNTGARALKTNRTFNIGILYAGSEPGLTHEYFSLILENFKSTGEAKGYDVTFVNNKINGNFAGYLEHCRYRRFDGVAVITADYTDPEIEKLCSSGLPVVTIDYAYGSCASVVADNALGMKTLTEYILKQGHRDIVFIHGENTEVTRNRINGFYAAMVAAGVNVEPSMLVESPYHDIESCYVVTRNLLKSREKPPTCIIFPDDYSYIGGYRAVNEAGLNIPDDISAVGYDNIRMSNVFGLTTFDQDSASIGRLAAEKLLMVIEDPKGYKEHSVVIGRLMERKTVKPIDHT